MRRLRRSEQMRNFVRETRLTPDSFVYPMFVCPGEGVRKEVGSMPGVYNLSVDEVVKEARELKSLGVPSTILFGLPEKKDEVATGAWAEDGIVQRATRAIKSEVRDLLVIGDVCLCEYMSHGHCGIVGQATSPRSLGARAAEKTMVVAKRDLPIHRMATAAAGEYEIVNDATLEILVKTAVAQARAGMDFTSSVFFFPSSTNTG